MKNTETKNVIVEKSYHFALKIVGLYKSLLNRKEYVLSKQVLRSGTSIGANINEAIAAESKRDFIHKLSISVKESRETLYWLRLLKDSDYISKTVYDKLNDWCNELLRILNSIILTIKQKYFPNIHNS
jgi:four helix bundle protein